MSFVDVIAVYHDDLNVITILQLVSIYHGLGQDAPDLSNALRLRRWLVNGDRV
jgi:hypothetical protein